MKFKSLYVSSKENNFKNFKIAALILCSFKSIGIFGDPVGYIWGEKKKKLRGKNSAKKSQAGK